MFRIYYVLDPQLVLSPIIFYVTDTTFVPKTELDHSEKFLQKQLKQLEKIISFGGIIFTHRAVQSDGTIQFSYPSSLFLLPFKTISNGWINYKHLLITYDSCRHFTPWGQEIHYFFCPRPNFSTWQTLTQIKQLFDCTVEHIETTAKRIFFTFSRFPGKIINCMLIDHRSAAEQRCTWRKN